MEPVSKHWSRWDDHDKSRAYAELVCWRAWGKRATEALVKVRPLGGSELFMRFDDDTTLADPEWCGAAIEQMREALHKERIENVRLLRAISEKSE